MPSPIASKRLHPPVTQVSPKKVRAEMSESESEWGGGTDEFNASIDDLDAAGLDTVALLRFMDGPVSEDFTWPKGVLEQFFEDGILRLADLPAEVNRSFLLHLGVRPDSVEKFWAMYDDIKEGMTIEEVLTNYFTSVVNLSEFNYRSQQRATETEPIVESGSASSKREKEVQLCLDENMAILRSIDPSSGYVDIWSQSTDPSASSPLVKKRVAVLEKIEGRPYWMFHSTILKDAASILEVGPFSPAGNIRADFNGAFYLNTSLEDALDWAEKRAKSSQDMMAVILVYQITPEYLSSLKVYRPDQESWVRMVRAFRGDSLPLISIEEFLHYDVVIGPKCGNPSGALKSRGRRHIQWEPRPIRQQGDQVAFTNPREANRLKHLLVGVHIHRLSL